jgi:hypothetical protein
VNRDAAERCTILRGLVGSTVDGDLDLTIYSLRKWIRLALKGNPTILLLLFTPEDQLVFCDDLGRELRALTPAIVSRRVQEPFLGYLQAQKQRLTGERGQKRIHRPELEEMYGFDTKQPPRTGTRRAASRSVGVFRVSQALAGGRLSSHPA